MACLGKYLVINATILCFVCSFELKADSNQFFLNGATLLNLCGSQSLEKQAACEGYIIGVQDSIYSGHLKNHINICFPKGVGTRQLRLNFIDYAKRNAEALHYAAEGLVAESVAGIFSCKTQNKNIENQFNKFAPSYLGCNSLLENCS